MMLHGGIYHHYHSSRTTHIIANLFFDVGQVNQLGLTLKRNSIFIENHESVGQLCVVLLVARDACE